MKVTLKSDVPFKFQDTFSVPDATDAELEEIRNFVRTHAGDEWGHNFVKIELREEKARKTLDLRDFADAIRYASDPVYPVDCPVFASRGIVRATDENLLPDEEREQLGV